jgi:hypothetical protein
MNIVLPAFGLRSARLAGLLSLPLAAGCAPAIPEDPADTADTADPDVTYTATWLYTALDRIWVTRRDPSACAWFILVYPMDPTPGVTAPPGWAFQAGGRGEPAACQDPWADGDLATRAAGEVAFDTDPNTAMPGPLTLDLILTFPDNSDVRFWVVDLVAGG